jgi:hypothetical protein
VILNHHLGRCSRPRLRPSRPLALGLGGTGRLALFGAFQLVALTGVTLAAACSFSFLIISAAVLAWAAQATSRCSARVLLVALTGVGLAAPAASARSSSRPLFPPSAWAAQATSHFSARAAHSPRLLGLSRPRLGRQGRLTLLGAHAGRCLDRHDARRRLQVQPAHHLRHCSRPLLGRHRPPRAARRACCSLP